MTRPFRILVAVVVIIALALALAFILRTSDEDVASPPSATNSAMPVGKIGAQGLTVAEALQSESPENLLVRGYLMRAATGWLLLCSALTEQGGCAAPFIRVEGEPGIQPSTEQTLLLGKVENGVLRVVNLASA